MRNSKVCPISVSNNFDASSNYNSFQLTTNLQLLDHGGWSRRGREFWYARRAFLNSYHLSLETNNGGIKEKLKKSLKEAKEAAMGVVLGMCRGMCKRRVGFGVRAYRVTMSLPSLVRVTLRCFMPRLHKRETMSQTIKRTYYSGCLGKIGVNLLRQ